MALLKIIVIIFVSAILGALLFQLTNKEKLDLSAQKKLASSTSETSINSTRPLFSLPDLNDSEHSITEWDGKLLLINFWASWCPPCIKEMPALDELRQEHVNDGFEILGIAIEPSSDAAKFLANSPVSYPILHGEVKADRIAREYGNTIGSIPYSALIDQKGRIIEQYYGEIEIQNLARSIKDNL